MSLLQPILLLAVLYNLMLVASILRNTHTNQAGRNFAWYILGAAAWTACVSLMNYQISIAYALWLARATFFCATGFTFAWLWFCANFPVPSPRFHRIACWLTVLGLPWLVLSWTPWITPNVQFNDGWVGAGVGPLVKPFTIWLIVCGGSGLAYLYRRGQTTRGIERLQIRYILLGGIGLAITGSIPDLILPIITGSTRYAPYGPLSTLFVTTTTTYAIVRYRLMDIKIVLRAGLVYSLTIGTLSLLFALLVPIFELVLTHFVRFPSRFGSFLSALLIALAFQPVYRYVQHLVDRRFFKSVYDYRVTLSEASNALASVRDRELLMATLENALVRTLRPCGVAIFLPGHDDVLTKMATSENWDELPHMLLEPEPVLHYAIDTDDVMLMEELIRHPEPAHSIGERMKAWNTHVAVPLIAGGRLGGMVFLGEKLSGDVYTADDVGLLRILGKQAAIALDNARHYHEMVLMNDYHARLLHIMQDGVIALDPQQRIITFNSAAQRITSVSIEEAVGKRLSDIGITDLPIVQTAEQGEETTLTTPTGAIPLLVTVTPFTRRWETSHSHLIVFRDLSLLRALEQQKMQAERFSSMGAMAASLAHEIKNPLVPIQFFAHMLPSKYDDAEFRKEFSETVVNEVERISHLVGQMLDLVRKPSTEQEVVNLREVIEQLLALVHSDCERQHIGVRTCFAGDAYRVVGVRAQLYQAILNVIMNSIQVMPTGGELLVSVEYMESRLVCRISDTGPGVPPEELNRIFEPLYTTKPEGHGLGLSFTYHFIRTHNGEVRAERAPNGGLMVSLVLPAYHCKEAELLCSS